LRLKTNPVENAIEDFELRNLVFKEVNEVTAVLREVLRNIKVASSNVSFQLLNLKPGLLSGQQIY